MSTRRKINKILKEKGLTANVQFDGGGVGSDSSGWWMVTFDDYSSALIRSKMGEPTFSGSIEFCDIEDGLEQLSEMPVNELMEVGE